MHGKKEYLDDRTAPESDSVEQRPWFQVFGLGAFRPNLFCIVVDCPPKKDPVRAQEKWNFFSQPFESHAASSSFAASRPDLDKIDW